MRDPVLARQERSEHRELRAGLRVVEGMVEQGWLGRTLRLGDTVRLTISAATERCGMVVAAQDDLAKEAGVLRHIAQVADMMRNRPG